MSPDKAQSILNTFNLLTETQVNFILHVFKISAHEYLREMSTNTKAVTAANLLRKKYYELKDDLGSDQALKVAQLEFLTSLQDYTKQ